MSDEVKLTWGKTENDLLQRWPKSADGTVLELWYFQYEMKPTNEAGAERGREKRAQGHRKR